MRACIQEWCELQAEVRRVNLRILAGDKIDDNLWISRVRVAVYDIYGNQDQVSAVQCAAATPLTSPSVPPSTISPQ